ncbi:MFS transporter [Chloroflexi bacterium TSY]|nr:MFS transporter [Chloroflexi bacterium TSY]
MNIFGYNVRGPNAYTIYLAMRAIAAFAFSLIITYELVYHTVDIGLNPLQLVTVGVVLESMTFLFEIPTGIVADAYSRRLSVLIGFFLIGVGFLIEGLVSTFATVLVAQVLWGIGFTFYSGAGDAWIVNEVGKEKAVQAFLHGTQLSQIMSLIGVGAGAFLVRYGLNWPIFVGASIYLVMVVVLMWYMTELGYQPPERQPDQSVLKKMLGPLREGVQLVTVRSILSTILLIGIVIGLYVGGFDRLYAAHLTDNFEIPSLSRSKFQVLRENSG